MKFVHICPSAYFLMWSSSLSCTVIHINRYSQILMLLTNCSTISRNCFSSYRMAQYCKKMYMGSTKHTGGPHVTCRLTNSVLQYLLLPGMHTWTDCYCWQWMLLSIIVLFTISQFTTICPKRQLSNGSASVCR